KRVLKLNKALYGLKQAPRQWNKTIDQFMRKLGYRPLRSDPCVYTKLTRTNKLMMLSLYVDDTVIVFHRDDTDEWNQDKVAIAHAYAIKDLGECNWILNMKVTRNRQDRTITLSQQAYVERICKEFNVENGRVINTPVDTNNLYSPSDGSPPVPLDRNKSEMYRSIVGALLYAANITRIDIAYAVGQLCRHTATPCVHHLESARRVLRYVSNTSHLGLVFGRTKLDLSECRLDVYCDADWGGDRYDGKSNTGCVVRFNGDVMNWVSKKQTSVAMSSAEAEYIAMAEAVKEALWYRSWILEVLDKKITANIICDNEAAIKLSSNDTIHDRSKHIRLRYHFIRDEKAKNHITVSWIRSAKQQADILTKALDKGPFQRLTEKLMTHMGMNSNMKEEER
ncbi:MAG TPA: reverse transcriptase domain-containing protein, partial [Candidatus Babeliaceae bacterium]|nr:reverse transcriptase domain-containing protein [Candidatus Babeliaceae bacterium]